jgi:hypothetical protein
MGQRSQQFIRVHNPLYQLLKEYKNDSKNIRACADFNKWKKALGLKPYTILTYHHQWLYGMTFPALMHQMLDFYKGEPIGELHPLKYKEYFLRNLRGWNEDIHSLSGVDNFVAFHTYLLSIYSKPWKYTRGRGLEAFLFTNHEEPYMMYEFDRGDNNDGICIVDAVNGKYAFMSIYGCEGKGKLSDYVPLSAAEYVAAYYPIDNNWCTDDHIPLTDENIVENKKRVDLVTRKYKNFAVLTVDEICKIFPKMKSKLLK